ncbi:Bug family tripartite tricarboxylate transporter substrate binding protein [Cupriavidus necator]|uniref:Bug family tripartite tricarboxylate transporter substrate binding protein n=1 Tax=Cupriavidus necator TaxID=106590 RepID=UPI0018AF78C6|nr:tripartite tricarboxylate transporter substrate binding protein [Cupriavidus necator]
MKIQSILGLLFGLTCTAGVLDAHAAEAYPNKTVTIAVPYAPGGSTDYVTRAVARYLGDAYQKPFLVENKPGASGTIAMAYVARAEPNGYTLMATEMTTTIVPALYAKLSFDPLRDFMPIAQFAEAPYVLVMNPKLPVHNLKELIAYARQKPGQVTFGSGGPGSGPHVAGELLKVVAKIDIKHVPYKGSGPALNDLLGGQIDILITAAPTVAGFIESGKLRAIAVASEKRIPLMQSVPTSAESGLPEFKVSNWFGLTAPRGTPVEVQKSLHAKVKDMLKNAAVLKNLESAGALPAELGPEDFGKKITAEAQRWDKLLTVAGAKLD